MNEELETLAEMSRDFAASHDIKGAMLRALARIAQLVGAEGGAMFLLDDAGENLTCEACFGPVDITGLTLKSDQGIVGRSVANKRSEMVLDVSKDTHFQHNLVQKTGFVTRSLICAPMAVHDEPVGAIELINKKAQDGLFVKGDLSFLEALAVAAGLAIVNARLSDDLAEQEARERELALAAEIQRGLLPSPGEADFPVCGINRPARVVSGDFYDFFTLYDGRIAFALADVSGKGMNAALLMAKAASLFRCLGKEDLRPARLLQRIDAEVSETALRGMFVTMVVGIYDPASGRVVMANAGHEPPLVQGSDGAFRTLNAGAPPIGIPVELTGGGLAPEEVFHLDGGTLYLFSDGVTEGYVEGDVELGRLGFQGMMAHNVREGLDVARRLERVVERLTRNEQILRDDITVMAIDDRVPARARTRAMVTDRRDEAPLPDEGTLCKLSLRACAQNLRVVRRVVEVTTVMCGFSKPQTQDIMLAVDEACQNVVRHAYANTVNGDMVIKIRRETSEFQVLIRDFAAPVDVAKIKPRDLDDLRSGGLGVHFIREVMDRIDYLPPPDGQGNLLRLIKKMPV